MGSVLLGIGTDRPDPGFHDPHLLAGRKVRRSPKAAWEQEVGDRRMHLADPSSNCIVGLLAQFEAHRLSGWRPLSIIDCSRLRLESAEIAAV